MNVANEHFHFVTGRLAEPAVREVVQRVAEKYGFEYSISVLPITVAALMTPKWLLRHLTVPPDATRVIVPGHLHDDVRELASQLGSEVASGPRDIRDLAMFFGEKRRRSDDYGEYSIEIIAEINHADRLDLPSLLASARSLRDDGADIIDLGCSPGRPWLGVAEGVRMLIDEGCRVSIDSFDAEEVTRACRAGAELVLSVNSGNRQFAPEWGCEVVAIPDAPEQIDSLYETADFLIKKNVPFRLDPILEPLGCGFGRSLLRYAECRRRFPQAPMMMGIGNVTELTDADSAALNLALLSICEEFEVQSVLTTQVINWARTCVRECDLARRLVYYSQKYRIPPKHLEPDLVLLRDERVHEYSSSVLEELSRTIRDKNIRIFNSGGEIHLVTAGVHVSGADPFAVTQQLLESSAGESIDREHAFYLGFEIAKALTARIVGKQYDQDRSLNWGFLTPSEGQQRLTRVGRHRQTPPNTKG